ncbi:MAG: CotH kinase family protein, partial [Verrucomicrobiales bacterium]
PADYEMDPEILDQFGEAAVTGALRHHPTISIVMDPDDLWNESPDSESGGIYPNPYGGTGNQFLPGWGEPRDWERSCSAEFIGFEQVPGKQVDCGIRIAGNYARHPNRYKHHLRLTFRRSYGAAKLKAPLFSRTDVDTFDDFILRGGNSESWTFPGASSNGPSTRANVQYIRDQFYKDAQAAMGHLTPSQEYFHLYLNGLYWGLYTLIERVDAHFMSQHLGGDEEDYDVMKQGNVLSDGSRGAWEEMFAISRSGMASNTNYEAIQEYLDLDNFIDYVLFNFWAGTADWRNNWRGGRLREPGAGFIYFNWDGERGLGDRSPRSFTFDSTGTNREWTYHATELHHDLKANPEYRIRFADRLNKHLFNDGALTPENAAALYNARAEEIIPSLVAESARWGDRQRPDDPYTTENEWKEMFDFMNGSFFPQRTPVLLGQLRATGVYPDTEPPVFSQHGGQVPIGYPLQILNEAGDVYFTTDGSDPRLVGGAINPAAIRVSGSLVETIAIGAGSDWRYDDSGTDLGTGWREAGYDDATWAQGPAPLGYGFVTDTTLGTIMNTSRNITAYLRGGFDLNGGDLLLGSTCDLHIDGGAIVYVNGVEVIRDEMPEGPISFTTLSSSDGNEGEFDEFPIPIEHFVAGENTIAVEVHNVSPGSSDMAFDMRLRLSGAPAAALEVTSPTIVRARSLEGGEWSALTEATFYNGDAASDQNLVISEIFYNPPGELEDGEFIELLNISDTAISLAGVRFDAGIQFEFSASSSLPPGGRVVLTPEDYTGRLANGGEELRLMASDQSVIRSFRYDDEDPWPTSADGLGRSLVLGNPMANPDHSLAESWLPSAEDGGSPGESGHAVPREGDDLETFFLGGRPVEVSVVDGRARVRVPRELGAGGADITIETSSDLRSWETGAASFDGIETDGGSAVMLWSLPLSDREVYARARITLSP